MKEGVSCDCFNREIQRILDRIAAEIRPKLELAYQAGHNCCGCSMYEKIVADIEAIVREGLETI